MNKNYLLAEKVLLAAKTPMTARQIWEYAVQYGFVAEGDYQGSIYRKIANSIWRNNTKKGNLTIIGTQKFENPRKYYHIYALNKVNASMSVYFLARAHFTATEIVKSGITLEELLVEIDNDPKINVEFEIREITAPVRDPKIIAYVRMRSKHTCECCGCVGFEKSDGDLYIEVHHLKMISEGGSDIPTNAVALCPNCHRKMHYADNRNILMDEVIQKLSKKGIFVSPISGFNS